MALPLFAQRQNSEKKKLGPTLLACSSGSERPVATNSIAIAAALKLNCAPLSRTFLALPLLARRQNSEKKARATTFSLLIRERTTPTQTLGQTDVKSKPPKLFAELMYINYSWLGSAGQQMLGFLL